MKVCEEWTIPQAGQAMRKTQAQVTRLITLGLLSARKDDRGWWRVNAESARGFAERENELQPASL